MISPSYSCVLVSSGAAPPDMSLIVLAREGEEVNENWLPVVDLAKKLEETSPEWYILSRWKMSAYNYGEAREI